MQVQTLAEELLFTTVNLEARHGEQVAHGTGFIYSVETDQGTGHLLVSNRHVLDAAIDQLVVRMIHGKPEGGPALGDVEAINIGGVPVGMTGHSDPNVDLAVLPLSEVLEAKRQDGFEPFFRSVPAAMSLTRETESELDALETVVFIGYPNNLYDVANNTPIMRQGATATPIALDYNGWPAFLIDASVFPGSSGSPVFIYDRGTFTTREGTVKAGSRRIFLGVLAAVHVRGVQAEVVETRLGVTIEDPLNLGIVFKAHALDELVDQLLEVSGLHRAPQQPTRPDEGTEPSAADDALGDAA